MQIILVVKELELCHFEFNVATYITQRCSKLKKKKRGKSNAAADWFWQWLFSIGRYKKTGSRLEWHVYVSYFYIENIHIRIHVINYFISLFGPLSISNIYAMLYKWIN